MFALMIVVLLIVELAFFVGLPLYMLAKVCTAMTAPKSITDK